MNTPDAANIDRADITRATAELLAAVNGSDADRCSAVWADDGVLMPPHHPSVQGHDAIVQYARCASIRWLRSETSGSYCGSR
jgi:ketosteroid isomerase-like protein